MCVCVCVGGLGGWGGGGWDVAFLLWALLLDINATSWDKTLASVACTKSLKVAVYDGVNAIHQQTKGVASARAILLQLVFAGGQQKHELRNAMLSSLHMFFMKGCVLFQLCR